MKHTTKANLTHYTVDKGITFYPSKINPKKGTYRLVLYRGEDKDKKPIREFKTFKTLAEAKKYKKEYMANKITDNLPPSKQKIKLCEYVEDFITNSTQIKKESTIYGYTRIQKYIEKSDLSNKQLQAINTSHIRNYMQYLQETTKMKPQTINKHLLFLSSVFDRAWKDDIIKENFVKKVDKLKPIEFKSETYNKDDLTKVFEQLEKSHNNNLKLTIYLGVLQGLRRGEMCGLKWENIDLEKGLLYIRETKIKVGGKIITKEPKTEKSKRTITILGKTLLLLKTIKQEQINKFGTCCKYVMVNNNGQGISPTSLQKPFNNFQRKLGIHKIRIHDLRHSFATLSKESGSSIDEISKVLGHSNTYTTEKVYIHLFDNENKAVISRLETMLFDE